MGFGLQWHDNPTTAYLANLRADVARTTGRVIPTPVPDTVVPGWVDPGFTTRPLVRLVNEAAAGSALGGGRQRRRRVGAPGAQLAGPAWWAGRHRRASAAGRSRPASSRPRSRSPEAAPYFRGSVVQLGVLVGDSTRLDLAVTGRDGTTSGHLVTDPPELLRGPHRVYALVPPGTAVTDIIVTVTTPNTAGVCITSAEVSTVKAVQ